MRLIVTLCLLGLAFPALADDGPQPVRIGVLTAKNAAQVDLAGGSVLAAQMAAEDFGGAVIGRRIDIVAGDHQNRPSVGVGIARRWFGHGGADVIVDVPNPSVAEAVRQAAAENHGLLILARKPLSTSPDICQSQAIVWGYDEDRLARGAVAALTAEGVRHWALFGIAGERNDESARAMAEILRAAKADIVADKKLPSPWRRPQAASAAPPADLRVPGADIAVLNMGPAAMRLLSQKLQKDMTTYHLPRVLNPSWALQRTDKSFASMAREIIYALPYDGEAATHDFAERYAVRADGHKPGLAQISVYAAVTHYLKAVEALNTAQPGEQVGAKMQELPTEDNIFGNGTIGPNGRQAGDIYVFAHRDAAERDRLLKRVSFAAMGGKGAGAECVKPGLK